jgi:hypothetical protein
MFEIALRLKQIEEQRKQRTARSEAEEQAGRMAKTMQCWLHSLLFGTLAIAVVDAILMVVSNS